MSDEQAIPAATVSDVDFTNIPGEIASEIQRLGKLMEDGRETLEEFARLVRLLHAVGRVEKSEYLLRRNVSVVDRGMELYRELFGMTKPDEFGAAIAAFAHRFSLRLRFVREIDFLEQEYLSVPKDHLTERPPVLANQCEILFGYAEESTIVADVSAPVTDDFELFQWAHGRWLIQDGDQS